MTGAERERERDCTSPNGLDDKISVRSSLSEVLHFVSTCCPFWPKVLQFKEGPCRNAKKNYIKCIITLVGHPRRLLIFNLRRFGCFFERTFAIISQCLNTSAIIFNTFSQCLNMSGIISNTFSQCLNMIAIISNTFCQCLNVRAIIFNTFSQCLNTSAIASNVLLLNLPRGIPRQHGPLTILSHVSVV